MKEAIDQQLLFAIILIRFLQLALVWKKSTVAKIYKYLERFGLKLNLIFFFL